MKRLEDVPLLYRILLAILIVAAVVLVLLIISRFTGEEAQAEVTIACVDPEERVRVREIVVQGLDQALRERSMHLFSIWLTDPGDQPKRATVGLTRAIEAHIRARKDALRWNPPACDADAK